MTDRSENIVLGFDLGGTKLAAVALPVDGDHVLAEAKVPTPSGEADLVDAVKTLASTLVADAAETGSGERTVVAAGLGAPGLVDRRGTFRYGANLPGVLGSPLADRLHEALDVPVVVDNDATCAAWAEFRRGAARNADHAVMITLGTGIGAGVIADGAVFRGVNGFASEPGHMVLDPSGPLCPCGRHGCWERYGSGNGLGWLARDAANAGRGGRFVELAGGRIDDVRGEHVGQAATEGDSDALEVLDRFGWWIAAGAANLVNLLDTELVVLGGGVIDMGELVMGPVRRHFGNQIYGYGHRPAVDIVAATLGSRAGAIGAALLAVDRGTS